MMVLGWLLSHAIIVCGTARSLARSNFLSARARPPFQGTRSLLSLGPAGARPAKATAQERLRGVRAVASTRVANRRSEK